MYQNYLCNLKSFGFITRPIDFSHEIHSILYLSNNNHIDLTNTCRILCNDINYGYLTNQQEENIYNLSPVYSYGSILIHTDHVNCTINQEQYNNIKQSREDLLQSIKNYKIAQDMIKITSLIINKKVNKILFWI